MSQVASVVVSLEISRIILETWRKLKCQTMIRLNKKLLIL